MKSDERVDNLGESLVVSVAQAGAADLAGEVGEMALDAALEDGLFTDVPVFGWMAKLYSITTSVRDRLFLKKVAGFLYGTRAANSQAREEFKAKLADDLHFSRGVGESVLLLLERHDHFDKSKILGRVFAEYMGGGIDYEGFLRIATSIDRVPITDLSKLPYYKQRLDTYDGKTGESFVNVLNGDTCQSLYTSGLVSSDGVTEVTYHPNSVMDVLVRLMGGS